MTLERVAGAGAAVLVAAGLVLGFRMLGSPTHTRAEALDRATLRDLRRRAEESPERRRVLCATFRLASAGSDEYDDLAHPAGRACFLFAPGYRVRPVPVAPRGAR